jgi:hypothetical protein
MSYKLVLNDDGSLVIRDRAGNVVKQLFADNYCGGRQSVSYPVCIAGTTNSWVTASCGSMANYMASQINARVGACN